jgi:uncharacterized protein with HEPN domain
MPPDRDDDLLSDIVAAARSAQEFTEDMDYADFVADLKTQSAVTFQLVIIGEAAKGLSDSVRTRYPDVPWSRICRARDLFVHHYRRIDSEELWITVSRSLSELLQALENRDVEP